MCAALKNDHALGVPESTRRDHRAIFAYVADDPVGRDIVRTAEAALANVCYKTLAEPEWDRHVYRNESADVMV